MLLARITARGGGRGCFHPGALQADGPEGCNHTSDQRLCSVHLPGVNRLSCTSGQQLSGRVSMEMEAVYENIKGNPQDSSKKKAIYGNLNTVQPSHGGPDPEWPEARDAAFGSCSGILLTSILLVLAISLPALATLYVQGRRQLREVKATAQEIASHLQLNSTVELEGAQLLGNIRKRVSLIVEQLGNVTAEKQETQARLDSVTAEKQKIQTRLNSIITEKQRIQTHLDNATAEKQDTQAQLDHVMALQESLKCEHGTALTMCSAGWVYHSGHFYYFSQDQKSWAEAEQFCVSQDSHLSSITSKEEQEYLSKRTQGKAHWIELTDQKSAGTWRWVDGTKYSKAQSGEFWVPGQPDSKTQGPRGRASCVEMKESQTAAWSNVSCTARRRWICKKALRQAVS
ncbi:C-type lectin domain family 4 member K-like [Alligator sinensis]|uniref:C-type lectin domain family 4 member K-like n=1 Tax=Alligator sinensis TaxID=38654 RepID=A0A3Q0HEZ2_ALLSI|nr:C-type lectin domain family 4 member K-like [Alligator sinensis]